jgi:hypothetical protein
MTLPSAAPGNSSTTISRSNQNKRNSSPSNPTDKTPSKRSKTGSSSGGGRPAKATNFVALEDMALCKAYVNVTLNPINAAVRQKSSAFWDHIHRKYCALLKEENPAEVLTDRDAESLKNRFQRKIQKKMNVYNEYYKQVKECPPSGVNMDDEYHKLAADNYRDAEGHAFPFSHCVEVLQQLPTFNPMVDDADRSSEFAAQAFDGDKKPAASVNKIGAPMGAPSKQPPGSETANKELHLRDMSLSRPTSASSAAMERIAESHSIIASTLQKLSRMQHFDTQMTALQIEYNMHQGVGDLDAARLCISKMQHLRKQFQASTTTATTSSVTEEAPPFKEVDLTNAEVDLTKDLTNVEVDPTNVEVDDSEAEQDVEETYSNEVNETEA